MIRYHFTKFNEWDWGLTVKSAPSQNIITTLKKKAENGKLFLKSLNLYWLDSDCSSVVLRDCDLSWVISFIFFPYIAHIHYFIPHDYDMRSTKKLNSQA